MRTTRSSSSKAPAQLRRAAEAGLRRLTHRCASDRYFGERDLACVLTSWRCFSTTRRNSRAATKRLALCRVLLHDPALLVLDEPYTALDAAGVDLLDEQLHELRGERTFLVSTHDPEHVQSLATMRVALAA